MTNRQLNLPWARHNRALVVALATLLLTATFLTIQHFRQDWPFSLHVAEHHDSATTPPTVMAGEESKHGRVAIDVAPEWRDRLGIKTEPARREQVSRSVRMVATVVPDEKRVSHIHTRVAGWIEELHVATTGQRVEQGQPLASIFSQELYSAQIEFLAAVPRAGQSDLLQKGARQRLQILGMSDAEITEISRSREPRNRVTITAPRSGVVLRRGISVGTAVDPSTELMTIADLSHVWIIAELPEPDVPMAFEGAPVRVDIPASGLRPFEATVDFLYPTLSERTRSLRVRIPVSNPEGMLRPGMSGSVRFNGMPHEALTVPRDAVVDTGEMQHVFVQEEAGLFEPRIVRLGMRLPERIEVLDGLEEGESVVTSGVFLIDSESRLHGSGGAGHAGHGGTRETTTRETTRQRPQTPANSDSHRGH